MQIATVKHGVTGGSFGHQSNNNMVKVLLNNDNIELWLSVQQ